MGSFKSAAARSADQATLTADDRPLAKYETGEDGKERLVRAEVDPANWLQPGESITYWSILPHGTAADIADAATEAAVEPGSRRRGPAQMKAVYHPGRAALATFMAGIVSFALRDENDQPVKFDLPAVGTPGWEVRAKTFMSALPAAVVDALQERIGSGGPESLTSLPADAANDADTVGND